MGEVVRVEYHNNEIPKLRQVAGSNWIDLSVNELEVTDYGLFNTQILTSRSGWDVGDGNYYPFSVKMKFGISVELPPDKEAHIVPRSSTFKNYGIVLVNSLGVIDDTYCNTDDEWFANFLCFRDFEMDRFARVCQFKIVDKMPDFLFIPSDLSGNKRRGGEGSTGK